MAYGLQVFNSSGNLIIDISSRLSRFVASGVVNFTSSGPSYVDIYIPGMVNTDTWNVLVVPSASSIADGSAIACRADKYTGYFRLTAGSYNIAINYWVFIT